MHGETGPIDLDFFDTLAVWGTRDIGLSLVRVYSKNKQAYLFVYIGHSHFDSEIRILVLLYSYEVLQNNHLHFGFCLVLL